MKAFVYSDWSTVEVKNVDVPAGRENEAIIRVEACGICGSELEAFRTRSPRRTPPLILGHEFCGVIHSINGSNTALQVGQKVAVNSVISCGKCLPCSRGDKHLCTSRQVFGMNRPGAMAEFVAAPTDHIYPIPESLDPVLAALAEPLANGVHVVNLMPQGEKKPVAAIIGAGTIGLMSLQAAVALRNARVLVADLNESRLEEARKLGAEATVNPMTTDLVNACREFSGADGVDMAIDAVGAAQSRCQSLSVLRPGGCCVWIGLHDNQVNLSSYDVVLPEKKVFGSYAFRGHEFESAIGLLADGRAVGGDWVKVFGLDDAVEAFQRVLKAEGNDIKAVIMPRGRV
ncbi:MAG: alcohol dehydrogenase catalytic domain-containing protein [Planctomycetes bacterium]|nr:alcohol dehydrogenase catalytic domain-containing protein [Planctomycetota bacterium]